MIDCAQSIQMHMCLQGMITALILLERQTMQSSASTPGY